MNIQYPYDRFHDRLIEILNECGESDRRLGYLWAAETDEDPATMARRINRLREGLPKPTIDIISLLDAMGYRVEIKKGRI